LKQENKFKEFKGIAVMYSHYVGLLIVKDSLVEVTMRKLKYGYFKIINIKFTIKNIMKK
jgi:hypothetical protein